MRTRLVLLAALLALPVVVLRASATDERYWAQWRGPSMTGVSRTAKPPIEWSETKNIKWKVEIPGRGSASPVVWGDRIYLLTAVPVGVDRTGATRAARRPAPARRASIQGDGDRSRDRQDGVGARRARRRAARGGAPGQRHLGLEFGDHRRHAHVCVLRIARPVCLRHERQADLADRLRRQEDAQPVRRGLDAGARTATRWSWCGTISISRRTSIALDKNTGKEIVARRSSRDGYVGDAAGRRARRAGSR